MKFEPTTIVAVVVAIGVVWYVVSKSCREGFVPEFLDNGNDKRTVAKRDSSYDQSTNHFEMVQSPVDNSPIEGIETPFRVNAYNSYMSL